MKRGTVNFSIDAVAFALLVLLATTGLLVHFTLPAGSGHFQTLWGMDRHDWGEVHFWIAMGFLGTLALHLVLHWQWITCMVKGKKANTRTGRVVLAWTALVAIVIVATAPFFSNVKQSTTDAAVVPHRAASDATVHSTDVHSLVDGSMTLNEVGLQTGIPLSVLIAELKLPADLSGDEKLGRLRREFGFEMQDVRDAVQAHLDGAPKRTATKF